MKIRNNKSFNKENSNISLPTTNLEELLNIKLPIELEYGDRYNFYLDENFAKYVLKMYNNSSILYCNRFRGKLKKCIYKNKKIYIQFCLRDTLNNEYCILLTDNDIKQMSKFDNGKMLLN